MASLDGVRLGKPQILKGIGQKTIDDVGSKLKEKIGTDPAPIDIANAVECGKAKKLSTPDEACIESAVRARNARLSETKA